MVESVVIIGGGPAGLAAAIYLARANLKPLLFAGSPPGGQLTLTSEVENYPGFESILGPELIEKMRNQAKKFGARIVDENVLEINLNKSEIRNPKSETNSKHFKNLNFENLKIVSDFEIRASKLYLSKSIIIATGAKALWLNLPSETRLRGHGVSACATCDGFFFRDKTVAVVGGGDTALEEALTLTKFAKKIYIIHRRDFFRASKIMQEKVGVGHARPVQKNPKIEIIWNAAVEEIIGERQVEGIKIKVINPKYEIRNTKQYQNLNDKNSKQNSLENSNFGNSDLFRASRFDIRILPIDGLFIAIGHKPDTDLFKGQIELDEKGYIKILERRSTSVPGVFVAGDCADPYYRQAVTAAGTGVEAALEVERYLET